MSIQPEVLKRLDAAVAGAGGVEKVIKRNEPKTVLLKRASDLLPMPIGWLWDGWLARGKLVILAGPPGQGKTTIAVTMVATVTIGGRWPDGTRCEPGNALIWSGEDDPQDTLVPRLMAAGADLSRVHFVCGSRIDGEVLPFDPSRDLVQLVAQAEELGDVHLLVVDPVVSAVMGDSHKNTEVRRGLQPLVDLGSRLNAAVLGISHFSKGSGGRDPTERVTGSIAFGAVPRVVLVAAKVKNEDGIGDRRILARTKSNIGRDDGGFDYTLEQVEAREGIWASRVLWGAAVEGTAQELLTEPDQAADTKDNSGTSEAVDALVRILGRDMVPYQSASSQMKSEGFTEKMIRNAREHLRVKIRRSGFGKDMKTYWQLPETTRIPTDTEEDLSPAQSCPVLPSPAQHLEWASLGRNGGSGQE